MARAEQSAAPPRLVVAGLAGDSGKSLVAIGLVRALRRRGIDVAAFKKGPDFIDAAWLGQAAGRPGRNLDTFLMREATIVESLRWGTAGADIAVVEGNRGLFDGVDAAGTHSTAELAKLLRAPVVLVLNVTKMTRTAVALVLGCRALDPELRVAGVILNRVGTRRQEDLIRQALLRELGVSVFGAIPRIESAGLPARHLGLVTPVEHLDSEPALEQLGDLMERYADLPALLAIAGAANRWAWGDGATGQAAGASPPARANVRIGVLRDRAFSFYYPENLEALQAAGAELVFLSPLETSELPELGALYAGGGFPEVYARQLAANRPFREALARRIAAGLPVWAECGGLAYLGRSLIVDGEAHPMVGALPIDVELGARPRGHGYVRGRVDLPTAFLPAGLSLRGHEFHYTEVQNGAAGLSTVVALERGVGVGGGRDGIRHRGVVAMYAHLHALATPEWAPNVVAAARAWASNIAAGTGSAALRPVAADVDQPRAPSPPRRREQPSDRERGERRLAERERAAQRLGAAGKPAGRRSNQRLLEALRAGRLAEVDELVAAEPSSVRYLLGLSYRPDPALRRNAARALGLAGRHHPKAVQNVVRRLIWAMNDESGTNAVTAPDVLQAVADSQPELLLPMVPDLVRLAADEGLREGLTATLRVLAERCPGQVGQHLGDSLRDRLASGGHCAD